MLLPFLSPSISIVSISLSLFYTCHFLIPFLSISASFCPSSQGKFLLSLSPYLLVSSQHTPRYTLHHISQACGNITITHCLLPSGTNWTVRKGFPHSHQTEPTYAQTSLQKQKVVYSPDRDVDSPPRGIYLSKRCPPSLQVLYLVASLSVQLVLLSPVLQINFFSHQIFNISRWVEDTIQCKLYIYDLLKFQCAIVLLYKIAFWYHWTLR